MLNIIPLEKQHISKVALIEADSFVSSWSYDLLLNEINNPLATYFLAEYESEIVGYIGFYKVINEADIVKIAVDKKFGQKGIAKNLLAYVLNYASLNGIEAITLEVNAKNTPAIKLYKSFGFLQNGIRPRYYEGVDDAILFKLDMR